METELFGGPKLTDAALANHDAETKNDIKDKAQESNVLVTVERGEDIGGDKTKMP